MKVSPTQKATSYLHHHLYQAMASLGELWRSPISSLLTIAVLGISLSLLASFHLIEKNAGLVAAGWQDKAEINLFISKDLKESQVQAFLQRLQLYPEIDSIRLITPDEGLAMMQQTGNFKSVVDTLEINPLPPVVVVLPDLSYRTAAKARLLLSKLEAEQEVTMGRLDIEWLERLERILGLFNRLSQILTLVLLAAVALIVSNTIRLNILNRRDQIEVMKLVGATNGFIQRPFLYTGLWFGLIGGIMASLLCQMNMMMLEHGVQRLASLYYSDFRLISMGIQEFLLVVFGAIGMSLLASWLSVRTHIAEIEPS